MGTKPGVVSSRTRREAKPERTAAANLTYHGGPVLPNVEVTTIFWGSPWICEGSNKVIQVSTVVQGNPERMLPAPGDR